MLAAIKAIQRVVGKDKLASLSLQPKIDKAPKRPIAATTLERISKLG